MIDLYNWLDEMATRPLPAAVSAAALAAAMGAALAAKAAATALRRPGLDPGSAAALLGLASAAGLQRQALLRLAEADSAAFAAAIRSAAESDRQAAVECPLAVAETCLALLDRLAPLEQACPPALRTDVEVGRRLLEIGVEAGQSAAESNLRAWAGPAVPARSERGSRALEEITRG